MKRMWAPMRCIDGHLHRWSAPRKNIQRVLKINASTKSLVERLCDFKILAISVLSFIGSVCAPDKATLKAENHALQCTTAGPYNALPSNLLGVGSICGLGPDLVGIHSISLAARHRVAACSTALSQCLEKINTARGHICTLIFPLSPIWEKEFLVPSPKTPRILIQHSCLRPRISGNLSYCTHTCSPARKLPPTKAQSQISASSQCSFHNT